MPTTTFVLARARTWVVVLFAVAAGVAVLPSKAAADAPRPVPRSPFSCGQVWFARTYAGHPRFAIDWNLPGGGEADFGQPVLAGGAGIVSVESDSGYGNMVKINHGDGWTTLYAHLSAVLVTTGQAVTHDTVIGKVGRTGHSDGSHLHQEQLLNGVRQPIMVDGVPIRASFSSRGSSYASGNCPPPVVVPTKRSAWACRIHCGLSQRRQLP